MSVDTPLRDAQAVLKWARADLLQLHIAITKIEGMVRDVERLLGEKMKLIIEWPDAVPADQFSLDFVQKMANRMVQGYAKYGPIERERRDVDRIKSLEQRISKYRETGNSEWLVDVGNMAMIQFILDGPERFHATPTEESPGLAKHVGGQRMGKDLVGGSNFYRHRGD